MSKNIQNIEQIQANSLFRDGSILLGFIGRSNVGKSSLLNAIMGKYGGTAAGVSPIPGFTTTINIYRWYPSRNKNFVNAAMSRTHPPVFWIDMPGYGYASVSPDVKESLEPMVKKFIQSSPIHLFVLIDSRHGKL